MATTKSRFWIVPMLILICSLCSSESVEAQCVVTNTSIDMPGTITTVVTKSLSAATNCTSVPTQMNAVDCNPGAGGASTDYLTADAMAATMNPRCVWVCGCGTTMNPGVTIDASDGLPVELMDFAVEDDVAAVSGE